MGRYLVAVLACALVAACSNSDGGGSKSPDGGAGGGGAGNGGQFTGGRSGGAGGSSVGGAMGGGAGAVSDGGASATGGSESGTGGTQGTGGASPACDAGCKTDCVQGCFDLGGCKAAGSVTLGVQPSVYTAGVTATGLAGADPADVYYRRTRSTYWWKGQGLQHLKDGRHAGSLFYLAPGSEYEVRVQRGTTVACATTTTVEEKPASVVTGELWVDAEAPAGGDGSATKPFRTIQEGVNAAKGGVDVHVRAGTYREEVQITAKSTGSSYLRVRGEGAVVLDGADPRSNAGDLAWRDDGGGIYSIEWAGDPRYVSRDGKRLYHYTSRAGLDGGKGYNDVPIAEGFYVENGRFYARLANNPSSSGFQIPVLGTAIQISGASGVWIDTVQIQYYGEGDYGKGIDVTENSSRIVIENNVVRDIPTGIWVRKGSTGVRIENNEIAQSTVFDWPWNAVKATDHENDAITLAGGEGAVVSGNRIHDVFNGVYAGSFDDDENVALAPDADVFRNTLSRIGDDGFEPEGACVNDRFWENHVDAVHNGISIAPITFGPVYAFKNRFTGFDESGFKFSNDSSGPVFLFHNTCYSDRPEQNGMNVSGNFSGVTFRNNVLRGTSYALESTLELTGNDLDYDALFTTRGAPRVKWNDVHYDDIAAMCAATGLECHGVGGDPSLIAPAQSMFAPARGSPLIDAAVRLYGINDAFAGKAPDIGYVEFGAVE